MKFARLLMSGIALAFVAAACGDDAVEPENVLTEEEAVALFESRASVTTLINDSTNRIHVSADSAMYRCPQGGQVKLAVTEFAIDTILVDTTRIGRIVLSADVTPRGCVTGGDLQFTLDGDPSLSEKLEIRMVGLSFDVSGSVNGGLKWALEDRSGSCEFDLALTTETDASDPDNPKLRSIYKGSLCGHQVEIATTVDIVSL